jgi:hypothetical protein
MYDGGMSLEGTRSGDGAVRVRWMPKGPNPVDPFPLNGRPPCRKGWWTSANLKCHNMFNISLKGIIMTVA